MFSRILTDYEIKMLETFLEGKANSESFRALKMRIKRNHDRLVRDMNLIEKAMEKFET